MEYEKCYILESRDSRPSKRRKTEQRTGLHCSWDLRHRAYLKAWNPLKATAQRALKDVNSATIKNIISFLDDCLHENCNRSQRIATGYVACGPNNALHASLLRVILDSHADKARAADVIISSTTASNLKTALTYIIKQATSREDGVPDDDDDEELQRTGNGPRLLNYDLQILADHVKARRIDQVVVGFLETEAFESKLLSELIELLGCWRDRIPFVFLFSIATSIDFLQQRLSNAAAKLVHGRIFDLVSPAEEVEHLFRHITSANSLVWIGSDLMTMQLERQEDYISSIDSFVDGVQYAYMTCFYANALTVFLDNDLAFKQIPTEHFGALRNLPSFQAFCQKLLENREVTRLRHLLDSDEALFGAVRAEIGAGRNALIDMTIVIDLIRQIQLNLTPSQVTPRSRLYVQAMSNKLLGSTLLRGLLLTIRKSPSSTIVALLDSLSSTPKSDVLQHNSQQIRHDLSALLKQQPDSSQPLRSEDDVQNSTLRTTVVAQKVELSKQKSALSKQDAAYTALLRHFTNQLEAYFTETLLDPTTLVFHEIFLYDSRSPHRETFTPRPRHAIERALATPHDYLDCSCCTPTGAAAAAARGELGQSTLAASQPGTAVLYQLYLESGVLVNVNDLWQAFRAVMKIDGGKDGVEQDDEGEEESEKGERRILALFQRGLAELRYLGFLKATRRRVDHVAKVAWRGL